MPQPNIKLYILISGIIVVFLVIFFSLSLIKRTNTTTNEVPTSEPTPTTFETKENVPTSEPTPTIEIGAFTGGLYATLPPEVAQLTKQKQDLRSKVPLTLSTFSIDFDYGEDKFVVTLNEQKDQARTEFENWRNSNYPALPLGEFIMK